MKFYPIGVSGHNYLKKQENIYSHSQLLQNGNIQIIQCDIKEKWMKVFTKNQNNTNDSDWNEMDLNELRKGIVVDLDDNGHKSAMTVARNCQIEIKSYTQKSN